MALTDLIDATIKWAEDRNILEGSTSAKQLEKTASEFTELCIAIGANDEEGIRDGIGDVLVTLVIVAEQQGMTFEECLGHAYNEIKDRKGRMINGKFVKESDL